MPLSPALTTIGFDADDTLWHNESIFEDAHKRYCELLARWHDAETVERLLADPNSGYHAEKTGVLLNGPIVPEGSRASRKGENRGGHAVVLYAWYRGKRAPYLYLEGSLRSWDGDRVAVTKIDPPQASSPIRAPADLLRLFRDSRIHARTLPGRPGYSPLVPVAAGAGKGTETPVNCPIVGTGTE
jgi:hypothetical protein